MRKNRLFRFLLLSSFVFFSCLNNLESGFKPDTGKKQITVFINQSTSRSVVYPDSSKVTVAGYSIYANNVLVYSGAKKDNYQLTVEPSNSNINFEIIGYEKWNSETEIGETPVLYASESKQVIETTTSLSFTVSLITQVYTSGMLNGVGANGKVECNVKLPAVREDGIQVSFASSYVTESNAVTSDTSMPLTVGSADSELLSFNKDGLNLGKHTALLTYSSNNGVFMYTQDYYVVNNVVTTIEFDLSSETFNPTNCTELAGIALYETDPTANLLTDLGTGTQFSASGLHAAKTYKLKLTMKVEGQSFNIHSQLYGSEKIEIISSLSIESVSFINQEVSAAQIVTFIIPGEKFVSSDGESLLQVDVTKGGSTGNYEITVEKEVPDVPGESEVSEVTHPALQGSFDQWGTDRTSTNPNGCYVISTEAELKDFRAYVNDRNGPTSYRTFYLGNNIELTSDWEPIAKESVFQGTFDGRNYTISNVNISSTDPNQAFFGYVTGGTIKNLTLKGSVSSSGNSVAGFVSQTKGSGCSIINCINKINVSGSSYAGAFIGFTPYGSSNVEIKDCINFGSVSATNYSGGILGYSYAGGITIINCANFGNVSGNNYISGIGGSGEPTVIIKNCHNAFTSSNVCGICYVSGGVTLGNSYYLSSTLGSPDAKGKTENSDGDTVSYYTHASGASDCVLAKEVESTKDLKTALNAYEGIGTTYTKWIYSASEEYKGFPVFADTIARLKEFEGSGASGIKTAFELYGTGDDYPSAGDTVAVGSISDLYLINKWVNASHSLDSVNFIMTSNIDYSNQSEIEANFGEGKTFSKIYNKTTPFSGRFDGNGKEISNFGFASTNYNSYSALFGYVQNATIENLKLTGACVYGAIYSGGLIGDVQGTLTINNCYVRIDVCQASSGKNKLGGIIGNLNTSSNVVIKNTIYIGKVTGGSYIGGFIGYAPGGTVKIENSACFADVTADSDDGCGFIGYNKASTELSNVVFNGTATTDVLLFQASGGSTTTDHVYMESSLADGSTFKSNLKKFTDNTTEYLSEDNLDLCTVLTGNISTVFSTNAADYNNWTYGSETLDGNNILIVNPVVFE